jgi:hypothetical protein
MDAMTITFVDGRKYIGEYKDTERNGQGTYTYPTGAKYVGEFKDGLQDGQGTYTWSNGTKYVGEWWDGNPWNGIGYSKDGNVIATFSDGVMTKK